MTLIDGAPAPALELPPAAPAIAPAPTVELPPSPALAPAAGAAWAWVWAALGALLVVFVLIRAGRRQ